ncbi:hypothetical protein [Erythrobacter sp. AP23]|uniref:hypothetical protein n=1 Tax=Erythrobacter sp. AP23 TaxID=499656 RepID=UPI00076D437D|nr:hypothetical protein [Erythrobacter sp. AP23]KWV96196.1 hypothetical protein ASS64_03015 [Erythrobacter sp. AP23]
MASAKTEVIEYLGKKYLADPNKFSVVTNDDIANAIDHLGADLSKRNPANFLKDIIRNKRANENWPKFLKDKQITARQRYGQKRVLQFYPYDAGQTVPFPDEFGPDGDTNDYLIQTASLPFISRQLGRTEETWLTQIAVNLRLVETQLSIFTKDPNIADLRDVSFLQTGIKTQPEIDAGYVASASDGEGQEFAFYVTCEVKQRVERILLDQIREQVMKAFQITKNLTEPTIKAVKPFAMQSLAASDVSGLEETEIGFYVIEFENVLREEFEGQVLNSTDDEALYSLELKRCSSTLYRCRPPITALR